jgi:hypothetical protein
MSKKLILFFLALFSIAALKAQKAPAPKVAVQKTAVQKTTAPKATAPVQKTTAQMTKAEYYASLPFDIPLMNDTWELIARKEYRKIDNNKSILVFPAPLQAMSNKSIELTGYMVPIKAGMTHSTFMMSVLPLNQCDFCGKGGVPEMIEVHMAKAIPYQETPIDIIGTLVLKPDPYASNVFLMNAEEY